MTFEPIGFVHSPFLEPAGMPLQPASADGVAARIEIHAAYEAGLRDLAGFSHILVLAHLHRAAAGELTVVPFLDDEPRGVFATRAPARPNPIGISALRLVRVEGRMLHVTGIDLLDGTPVLDLKPYVPEFDAIAAERVGWYEGKLGGIASARADGRFDPERGPEQRTAG